MWFQKNSAVEYLIVGLGNPGKQYEHTRHNAGFEAVDFCAEKWGISVVRSKFDALTGTGSAGGKKVMLMKPQTFMNASGQAVKKAVDFYKLPAENVIVLFDDISLDPGKLRLRKTGSAGGHNGIKSLISAIGQDFPRVKIGVGKKPHPDYDLADWVLSRFSQQDTQAISARWPDIAAAVELLLNDQFELAQSRYNG